MSTIPDPTRVRVFDTTLRDGEQSPGASLTSAEKLEIARQLAVLRVDIIEAGFPSASADDLRAVERIAGEIGTPEGPTIAGLARAKRRDIDQAWRAVRPAAKPRIHTFIATSDLHMERKLNMSRDRVARVAGDMVSHARSYCTDVEFSPEDATRSDPDFLVAVLAVAIEAGATTLNIPDTVGYAMPLEYAALLRKLISETPGADRVIWSVHCHDDLGCATANTIAGILEGARQIEVTVNGIGERAGNTSLEEVVMALHTRRGYFRLHTDIDTRQLARTSRLVSNYTGIVVPPNKAVVGANAFAHEAGIHQDGMLKDKRTYEIMTPQSVGLRDSKLVLGKHSGRHAFRMRMRELGFDLSDKALDDTFRRFKELADKKKKVTDADLQALGSEEIATPEQIYRLVDLQVACGRPGMPTATVRLKGPHGAESVAAAVGTGPVDAIFKAMGEIIEARSTLVDYSVYSVTEGIDALGEVSVRITPAEGARQTFAGYSADTDIIVASAKAYLAAINRVLAASERRDLEAESTHVAPEPDADVARTGGRKSGADGASRNLTAARQNLESQPSSGS